MDKVPKVISEKDLDYLSDMFNWNYLAYKNTNSQKSSVENEEIKLLMDRGYNLFNSNIDSILEILEATNE